ncbi:uncharacterized protein GGS22DRAFT_86469 [Annulohypoxylon maeteangense]|uniref:uncharacterized protein n=1 Tax=Annulohypoxylon maeteangense TaxID=1927788 RepID=UPI002007CAB0|nr:uncharacterized protein GGS22DRAFT_86469 [Annulohypoxylon maeteangense]KAI0880321.1 hypothetical protein GGS22DRAFT_86469 [Annulohypoxylon maeteangense]
MPGESETAFVREVWGLQGTAYLVVGLRYFSRISTLGWRSLSWDDAIMLLAIVVYTAESLMAYLVVAFWHGLANNALTDEERAALDPQSHEWHLRVNGSKTHVIGLLLYTTLLWLLKACWVVYYSRLTDGINNMKKLIHWGTAIVLSTYISCLLVAFLKCIPFNHQWQINPSPGNHCMPAISTLQTVYVMVMNTITDFYLMAIPLPMVWIAHLPWRKKLVLLIMFSGGFLEMTFGILRCVSILTRGDTDPAQSGYWSVRESFVSVVLTNMPMVYPIFRNFVERGLSISRPPGTSQGDSRGYKLGSIPGRLETIGQQRQRSFSNPNNRGWGSSDHIMTDRENGTASNDEEASIDLPKHQANDVISVGTSPPSASRRIASTEHQIVITTEYTVTEESTNGPRNLSRSGFQDR